MKITEQTTFAELQEYLNTCGNPFVTLMAASNMQPCSMHAVVHVPHVGTFNGNGDTVAQALEEAFTAFRRATLPEGLKQVLVDATHPFESSSANDPTPCCAQCGNFATHPVHEAPGGGRRGMP